MDPRTTALFAKHDGLVLRRHLLSAGVSPDEIARLVRSGEWVIVRRGVYARAAEWAALDPYAERPRQRAIAVHLTTRTDHVLSHDSAAHELGLAILRPTVELVHITRPFNRSARTRNGVKHHGALYRADQVRHVDGVPVLDPARTAVDMAREYGVRGGLPTFDAALRAGVTRSDLRAAIGPMRGWPDVTAPRACLELADAGAESVGESLAREFVHELGIGEPETQFPVLIADGRVMWCDLRVGCHVIEFDGRVKYLRQAEGGVAERDIHEVLWEEKKRERDVCAQGLGMSRLIWEDFWGEARERAMVRVRREYDETRRRYGIHLPPHLAEFADRMRGRRRGA